jgi:hypothetical protein
MGWDGRHSGRRMRCARLVKKRNEKEELPNAPLRECEEKNEGERGAGRGEISGRASVFGIRNLKTVLGQLSKLERQGCDSAPRKLRPNQPTAREGGRTDEEPTCARLNLGLHSRTRGSKDEQKSNVQLNDGI